jgi:hypothetical protein
MTHKCEKEGAIEAIRQDVREIRQDVKLLLQFKWKIVGGSVAGGIIITLLYNILKDFK